MVRTFKRLTRIDTNLWINLRNMRNFILKNAKISRFFEDFWINIRKIFLKISEISETSDMEKGILSLGSRRCGVLSDLI